MQRVLNLWRSMLSAQRGERDRERKREKSSVSLLCEFLLINLPHYRTEIAKVNRHTYEYIVDIVKVCQSMTSYREYLAISFCFQIRSDTGSYLAYSWARGRRYRFGRTTPLIVSKFPMQKTTGINIIHTSSIPFIRWISSYFLWFALALVIPIRLPTIGLWIGSWTLGFLWILMTHTSS